MPPRHVCPLCDFSREAEHATVLDPACPSCGSVLAASVGPAPVAPEGMSMARLARARWFERTVMALVVTPLLLASAKVGWGTAGMAGALGALLVAGLASYVALAPATRHH